MASWSESASREESLERVERSLRRVGMGLKWRNHNQSQNQPDQSFIGMHSLSWALLQFSQTWALQYGLRVWSVVALR